MLSIYPAIIFLLGLAVGWAVRLWYTLQNRHNVVTVKQHSYLELPLVVLAVVALHGLPAAYLLTRWLEFADYRLPLVLSLLGTVLMAAGVWLFWRSHTDLGRHWAPIPQIHREQSLVTSGVYRRIRHPMYAAHWLCGVAQALLLENWVAGPTFLALYVPIYLIRVAREERLMLDHFGEQYRRYMRSTGQVIPPLCRTDF